MNPLRTAILYAVLLVCAAAVFLPARNFQFVNWDDQDMLVDNPLLHPPTADHLQRLWTGSYLALYIPLTYSVWWSIIHLSDGSAGATTFHLLNIALHLASVALVFSILLRCIKSPLPALAGAFLFALHPLQVEGVVWIAELNNVLAGALSLAAIRLYLAGADASSRKRWTLYVLASLVFLLALFAKPSAVVVPLIAAVLDVGFIRRPLRQVAVAILPWLCAAGIFAIVAHGAQPAPDVPIWQRPIVALDALGFYLAHLFWPARLTIDYFRTPARLLSGQQWIPTTLLALAAAIALWFVRKRARGIVIASLVFLAALLPVLGLVPFEFQEISTVADRYLYLAMLGPALAFAWALAAMRSRTAMAGVVAIIALLAWRTSRQIQTWRDNDTLADYTLRLDPLSVVGNKVRAETFAKAKQWKRAVPYYRAALTRKPNDPDIHYNLANSLLNSDDPDDAIPEYHAAIAGLTGRFRLRAMNNLGVAYGRSGRPEQAQAEFERVLFLDPHNADAWKNLNVLAGQGVPTP